ncbi:phophosugar binding protein [Salmonella enterica subsp. arizonae]|uniref:Phophosugar binding protein n=1 Tax=Salmonella enterica subsp. arizonae TaxID=59203 RepID=A0A2X4TKI6_SALER|nr:phophosugar binding protein [Salmonella enterica subsp. arizonae]
MNLGALVSETRNPQTMDLDALPTPELVKRFNEQDTLVAEAVKATLPEVARAVDAAAAALQSGGRIIYMGAGTSGRLGVLDASECPPTFGVPHGLVVGLIAGGPGALLKAVEGAEDSQQAGRRRSCRAKSARRGSGGGACGVRSYSLCDWRSTLCAAVWLYHRCRLL